MTRSARFIIPRRASRSFRRVESIEIILRSVRPANRWRICKPVVPASPSMNTFGAMMEFSVSIGSLRDPSCRACLGQDRIELINHLRDFLARDVEGGHEAQGIRLW